MNPRTDLTEIHHFTITVVDIESGIDALSKAHGGGLEVVDQREDWAFLRFANIFVALLKIGGRHPSHIARTVNDNVWGLLVSQGKKVHKHRDGSESIYLTGVWGVGDVALEILRESSLTERLKL